MPKSQPPFTPEEREQRLIEASEKYMRGEITVEAFEEAERQFMPDYESAFATLGWRLRRAVERPRPDRAGHTRPSGRGRLRVFANS